MADWMLDELAHAGREHLDEAYVAGYEAKSQYVPAPDVAVLRAHGLDDTSTVLDLGALRRRVDAAGLDNVEIAHGGFLSYEHRGTPPRFAFSRNALHQLPDFWKGIALARLAAVLAPGAVLRLHDLVFDFEPADAEARIASWMAGAVDDAARVYTAGELAEHVRLEHSTYSWLFEPLLARTGFEILERTYVRGAYTCRRN